MPPHEKRRRIELAKWKEIKATKPPLQISLSRQSESIGVNEELSFCLGLVSLVSLVAVSTLQRQRGIGNC
jgi:hypothetical protein